MPIFDDTESGNALSGIIVDEEQPRKTIGVIADENPPEEWGALGKAASVGENLFSGGLRATESATQGTLRSSAALQENVSPTKARALESAATMIEGVADKIFTPDELPEDASVTEQLAFRDIPQGVGQAGTNLIASFINRPLSMAALFGQGYEGQREDAEMEGADEDTQQAAGFAGGTVEALTETIGLEAIRAKLPLSGWKGKVAEVGFAAATNSLQETAAGMLNDMVAKYGLEYDPDRDIWKERKTDAIVGGAVGGILGTLTTLAGLRGRRIDVDGDQTQPQEPSGEEGARDFFDEAMDEADADAALEGELLSPEEVETNLQQLERYGEIIEGELADAPTPPTTPTPTGIIFDEGTGAAETEADLGGSEPTPSRVVPTLVIDADTRQPVADMPPSQPVLMPPSDIPEHTIELEDAPAEQRNLPQIIDTTVEQEVIENAQEMEAEAAQGIAAQPPRADGLTEGENRTYLRLMDKVDMGTATPQEMERFTQLQEKSTGAVQENIRRAATKEELAEMDRVVDEIREIEGRQTRGGANAAQLSGLAAQEMEGVVREMGEQLPQLPKIKIFNESTPMPDVAKKSSTAARAFFVPAQPNHPEPVMYLKEGSFTSPESLQRAIVHEGVVHHGLRALAYEQTSDPFEAEKVVAGWMEPFYESFSDEINQRIVGQLGYELDTNDPAQRATAAEEWLADMAERKDFDNKFKATWNKFVTRVMRWLRNNPVTKKWSWVKKAKRSEVESLLEQVYKRTAAPKTKVTTKSMDSRLAKVKVVNRVGEMDAVVRDHPLTKFPNKAVLTEVNSQTYMPVESVMGNARQVIYPQGNREMTLGEVLFESDAKQRVVLVKARDSRSWPIIAAQLHRQALVEGRDSIRFGPGVDAGFVEVMNTLYPALPELDRGRSPYIPPLMQREETKKYDVALKEYGLEEIDIALQRYRHDKVGFFLKNFGNLMQIVRENEHVPGVLDYWNAAQQIPAYTRKHARVAENNIKALRDFTAKEQENLWNFMMHQEFYYDYSKEHYGTSQWIVPHSGIDSNAAIAPDKVRERTLKKFNIDERLLEMYDNIATSMHSIIVELEQLKLDEIERTLGNNPEKLAKARADVVSRFKDMKQRPYLPRLRFGKYVLRAYYTKDVKNAKGEVIHAKGDIYLSTAFESKRERARIAKKINEEGYKVDVSKRLEGVDTHVGILNSDFIELLKDNLDLTQEQRAQMVELMEQYSPTVGFAKHLKQRKGVAGWSNDFRRAYATYMMTAGHALAKIKYKPEIIRASNKITQSAYTLFDEYGQPIERLSNLPQNTDTDSRQELAKWFKEHSEYLLGYDSEMAYLNTAAYINYLWAIPKAAVVNLSQTPVMTLPYLGSRYGYTATSAELIKNMKYLQMWNTDGMKFGEAPQYMRDAIEAARNVGLFDETLMRQLGNAANGYEITKSIQNTGQAWDRAREGLQQMMWIGGMPFNAAEKVNRILAFTTAYTLEHKRLAKEAGVAPSEYLAPQLAAIQNMESNLLNEPTQEKTAPFVAGRMAVQQTQFIFGKMNRPKVFRGSYLNWLGSMQTPFLGFLYNMGRDQSKLGIALMILLASGIEGFPFMEWQYAQYDIMLTKAIEAYGHTEVMKKMGLSDVQLPVNTKQEVREFLRTKLENPIIDPMVIASGLLGPEGALNIASSISMGDPLNLAETMRDNALLKSDRNDPALTQSILSSLVVPDMVDSYYAELTSSQSNSLTGKLMGILPGIRKPYQAYKWFEEGGVYTKGGIPLVEFGEEPDATNPYTMEWMGAFLGFNPSTISQAYERYDAASDAARYWTARREDLRTRAKNARTERSQEIVDKAIDRYNNQIPKEAYGKLRLNSSSVIQAEMTDDVIKSQYELNIPAYSRDRWTKSD